MIRLIKLVVITALLLIVGSGVFRYMLREKNTIYVGVDGYSAPFSITNDIGELRGFNIDLMNIIGNALDLNIEFRIIPFSSLERSLTNGQVDVVIAPFDAKDLKSGDKYLLSIPYYKNNIIIVRRNDETSNEFLEKSENKSTSKGYCLTDKPHVLKFLRKNFSNSKIMIYESTEAAFKALYTGNCIGVVDSLSSANYYITKHKLKQLNVLDLQGEEHYHLYRVAVSPNNIKLLDNINRAILYAFQTGQLDKISNKWFSRSKSVRYDESKEHNWFYVDKPIKDAKK